MMYMKILFRWKVTLEQPSVKNNSAKGGALLKVNKLHDYFTSALPQPQKGEDVTISSLFGDLPVVSRTKEHFIAGSPEMAPVSIRRSKNGDPLDGEFYSTTSTPSLPSHPNPYSVLKIHGPFTGSDDGVGISFSNLYADPSGADPLTSKLADQIFGDFYVKNLTTRVMPVHSIPGLHTL